MSDTEEYLSKQDQQRLELEKIEQEFQDVLSDGGSAEAVLSDLSASLKKRESDTRNSIAQMFVRAYISLIPFIFGIIVLFNFVIIFFKPDMVEYLIHIEDTLMVLQVLLGTPLGFVVGYYFKSQEV